MVTVNDLVRQRVIFPKLRFLLALAGAIILILDETLETQLAVGAKNHGEGRVYGWGEWLQKGALIFC